MTPMDIKLLKRLVLDQRDNIIGWRRRIHQHPELGLDCFRAADLVNTALNQLGLDVVTDLARTGIAACLHGKTEAPLVALRVDMDALPISEQTGLPFASKVKGCMHACGHDGHTAIGLGAATVLAGLKTQLPGSVKFIFQPAEESDGGAKRMIADGVLDSLIPETIVGHLDKSHITVHTYPESHPDSGISTFRVDIDVSTCGRISPLRALNYLIHSFDSDIVIMDYRVRGFTRDIRGKKHYIDHKINSIQNFIW